MQTKVRLVNMPFGAVGLPSIAITQLRGVIQKAFGSRVSVSLHYLNHDISRVMSPEIYRLVSGSGVAQVTGLGDWLFTRVAFPEIGDNKREYFGRYGRQFGDELVALYEERIEPFRATIDKTLDELIEKHCLFDADIVGLTSMFSQTVPSIALARRLRLCNPDALIVMGGANCEGAMGIELVNNVDVLDFVFSGPGLVSFRRFVEHVLNGDTDGCHRIDGVVSKRNSMPIARALEGRELEEPWTVKPENLVRGMRPYGAELDINELIDLDYDDFFESLSQRVPGESQSGAIFFETSRGCWWGERAHCTFCGLNGTTMAYRAMHPELALKQLKGLFKRYGARAPVFQSVDNIMPREYFQDVFDKLETPENIELFYEVKADLTREQVAILARARVLRIQPGIESLATSTLKLMRKGTTVFHNIRLLKYCLQYGVTPEWNLLMGFPGETAEVYARYKRVLPTLFHLPPPMGAFTVRFDRFSPYFTEAKRYGLQLAPYDYYSLCYPFAPSALANMAYFYVDRNFEADYAKDAALWLRDMGDLVARWRARWAQRDPPQLRLIQTADQKRKLIDSRSGARRVYPLSDDESSLLALIEDMTIESSVPTEYARAMNAMHTIGAVFDERGRVASVAVAESA